ncbi:hypothetical protein ABZ635_05600 [Nocardiopsis sp. NPDC007018]|uniref:hypothetical protein n=1 Tax=Nocardiopsis sp. NPDC007018 TaxID=3155721 RepID=UPI0033DFB02E
MTPTSPETPEAAAPTTPDAPLPPARAVGSEASEAFLDGRPARRRDSLFGPATFSVAGVLLLATTLLSTQLIGIFNTQTLIGAQGTLGPAVQGELTGAGLFSALAVLSAATALFRSRPDTRPWIFHLAAATVLVGLLLVALTVLSYALLTPPVAVG